MTKYSVFHLGIISLFILFQISCITADSFRGMNLVSAEEEEKLGLELSANIAKQRTLVTDPAILSYVTGIGNQLKSVSQKPNANYRFYVVEDKTVNAFAIPGGHMYVHTGLIEAADSEAELAAVMAHEMGHAEKRHPTQQLSLQIASETITGIVLGEDPGQASQIVAALLATSGRSAYSRTQEFEADKVSLSLLNRSGYDPNGMVTFFGKLQAMEKQGSAFPGANLFASHPPTSERIANAQLLIQSFGAKKSSKKQIIGNFANLKSNVKAWKK